MKALSRIKKPRKGIGMDLMLLIFFTLIFFGVSMFLGWMGTFQVINEKKMLKRTIRYETNYGKVVGELNQYLTVNNFQEMDPEVKLGEEEKGLLFSEWMALYVHGKVTDSKIHLSPTDPYSKKKSPPDMRGMIKGRLKKILENSVDEGIYYNLTAPDIIIAGEKPETLPSLSTSLLPIPAPGGEIYKVKYTKEGTAYSIRLE